jgi:nitroimidazol reductase NimA-like FMN-containing flavoprotein (pyridoxamine 5'-phosphate oxidase superfamily)
MPGYGIPESAAGMLDWGWAEQRLTSARIFMVATAERESGPHLMPVWGVWFEERLYFSTGDRTRKARSLAADPRCSVATERADEVVVIEGLARRVSDPAEAARVDEVYTEKYGTSPAVPGSSIFAVEPSRAFGLDESTFGTSATRWDFG